jgi:hypothetical protein
LSKISKSGQGQHSVYSVGMVEYIPCYSAPAVHCASYPQSTQSAGPVRFLIFCSISILLLASLVAGRDPSILLVQISRECTPPHLSTGISNLLQPAQAEVVLGHLSRSLTSWLLPASRLASRKILGEQNIKIRTTLALSYIYNLLGHMSPQPSGSGGGGVVRNCLTRSLKMISFYSRKRRKRTPRYGTCGDFQTKHDLRSLSSYRCKDFLFFR